MNRSGGLFRQTGNVQLPEQTPAPFAVAIMRLIHSARINGHDPYDCMKDVLERLPLQPFSRIKELLPHRWNSGQ